MTRARGEGTGSQTVCHSPDRVSLLHKGGYPLWRSGCGYPIADKRPSSAIQLPILAALHAGFPTLFADHYTRFGRKCKDKFSEKGEKFLFPGTALHSVTIHSRAGFGTNALRHWPVIRDSWVDGRVKFAQLIFERFLSGHSRRKHSYGERGEMASFRSISSSIRSSITLGRMLRACPIL